MKIVLPIIFASVLAGLFLPRDDRRVKVLLGVFVALVIAYAYVRGV
ncbi:MAG TPA: hypothetical protein VM490_14440 [Armatimonadaceae bacterium]|nr:hypothetical protein [Armatimonadaceae bacterium]